MLLLQCVLCVLCCGRGIICPCLSIVLYLAAVLLLAGGVQIEENSAMFAAEGMSGYAGFSWCILIDFVVFALVLTAQRLFFRRVYKE